MILLDSFPGNTLRDFVEEHTYRFPTKCLILWSKREFTVSYYVNCVGVLHRVQNIAYCDFQVSTESHQIHGANKGIHDKGGYDM